MFLIVEYLLFPVNIFTSHSMNLYFVMLSICCINLSFTKQKIQFVFFFMFLLSHCNLPYHPFKSYNCKNSSTVEIKVLFSHGIMSLLKAENKEGSYSLWTSQWQAFDSFDSWSTFSYFHISFCFVYVHVDNHTNFYNWVSINISPRLDVDKIIETNAFFISGNILPH